MSDIRARWSPQRDPSPAARRARAIARLAFRLAVPGLWAVAAVLLLEIAALGLRWAEERANPIIQARRAGQAPVGDDAPVPRPAPPPPAAPTPLPHWLRPTDPAVLERHAPEPSRDLVPPRPDGPAFFDLDPAARDDYARARSKKIALLDHDGALRARYGLSNGEGALFNDWFVDPAHAIMRRTVLRAKAADFRRACAEALAAGEPVARTWRLRGGTLDIMQVQIVAMPDPGHPGGVAVFQDIHPAVVRAPRAENLPPDTLWAIPWFRYAPHRALPYGGFSTNNAGLRGGPVELPKPPGRFRVLCIGGSTTEEGAFNDTTYPGHLGRMLREARPGRDIDVLNAGAAGLDTVGHLARWPEYLALQPDLIVMYIGINDLWDIARSRRYDAGWIGALDRFASVRRFAPRAVAPPRDCVRLGIERETVRNLAVLADLAVHHGIAVAVASIAIPDREALTPHERGFLEWNARSVWEAPQVGFDDFAGYIEDLNTALAALAASRGLIHVPAAERIRGGLDIFGDVCHMLDGGIALKARVVCEAILPCLDNAKSKE